MRAFGSIFSAKFSVLREIETRLKLHPIYDQEYQYLLANPWYARLTLIDSITPVLFAGLFSAILFCQHWISI